MISGVLFYAQFDFCGLISALQVGSTEDLFSKEWHRAISITRDGCNNVHTTSMDALDGVRTSPTVTSPSTPDGLNLKGTMSGTEARDIDSAPETDSSLPRNTSSSASAKPDGSQKHKASPDAATSPLINSEDEPTVVITDGKSEKS